MLVRPSILQSLAMSAASFAEEKSTSSLLMEKGAVDSEKEWSIASGGWASCALQLGESYCVCGRSRGTACILTSAKWPALSRWAHQLNSSCKRSGVFSRHPSAPRCIRGMGLQVWRLFISHSGIINIYDFLRVCAVADGWMHKRGVGSKKSAHCTVSTRPCLLLELSCVTNEVLNKIQMSAASIRKNLEINIF